MIRLTTFVKQAAITLAACFLLQTRAAEPSLVWLNGDSAATRPRLEARNLPKTTIRATADWDIAKWQTVFAVFVETGDIVSDVDLPPLLGTYIVEGGIVQFTPQFDLDPGIRLRGLLRLSKLPGFDSKARTLTASHRIPETRMAPSTLVAAVYPSASELPENLLKFYIHFTAPMSRGRVYDHIRLLRENGKAVELPFLELDEELWSPDMKRLTLFIDPGRIKREVKPLQEIGPSLETGKLFQLVIEPTIKDANGADLKSRHMKSFRVSPPDRTPIDTATWKLELPAAGTKDPLRVLFPKPMDHAISQRVISVHSTSGSQMEGTVSLGHQEREWRFQPETKWAAGDHNLLILTTIEDLSGNNIGKAFEVDIFNGVARRITQSTVSLPFTLK